MPDSSDSKEQFRFKVNLGGMIELLSNHLYSSPDIYIRELLQNATDAIQARNLIEKSHEGKITLEIIASENNEKWTLMFEDNGVGLTEEEIHQFLAIIGESSKRNDLNQPQEDFIGRFGIGLLSCFMVSEEIVLITRSIKSKDVFEWRGRPDGTYSIKKLEITMEVGTRIYLRSKQGCEQYFQTEYIKDLILHYGRLLPFPIFFKNGSEETFINETEAAWLFDKNFPVSVTEKDQSAIMHYGTKIFEEEFLDFIPLFSEIGKIKGVAYILPHKITSGTHNKHRIYLKRMLLSEESKNILPDWAFFVKCIINANDLRPTASREGLYEDQKLEQVREELSKNLKSYLIHLAKFDVVKLRKILSIHYLSIKSLALQDDTLYSVFIDYLPFETSMGEMSLGEIKKRTSVIQYTSVLDEFRQISHIASAQSLLIVNGGYVYDSDLLERLPRFSEGIRVEKVDPVQITQHFSGLSLSEQEEVYEFIKLADTVLQKFKCRAEIKKFQPKQLSAIYSTNEESTFLRALEQTKTQVGSNPNQLFNEVLESFSNELFQTSSPYAQLCFNFLNPFIQKLIKAKNKKFQEVALELIYVHALLMGHYPLQHNEMDILNNGLMTILDFGLDQNM